MRSLARSRRRLHAPLPLGAAIALLLGAACSDVAESAASDTNPLPGDDAVAPADVAADAEAPGDDAPGADALEGPWSGPAHDLVQARCGACHGPDGPGPADFTRLEVVRDWASAIRLAVDAGRMPPWAPDDACVTFEGSRRLTNDERALLLGWLDAGLPAQTTGDYTPPPTPATDPGPPSLEAPLPQAYTPSREKPDDYRCFLLDQTFDAETLVTGLNAVPGEKRLVHHALLFRVKPGQLATVQALEAQDADPGYACYGSAGLGAGEPLLVWVPGQSDFHLPPKTAMVVEPGTRLLLQMHYNTAAFTPDAEIPSDRTRVQIWTMPPGEVPEKSASFFTFINLDLDIPAGAPASVHTSVRTMPTDATFLAMQPHMHGLGRRLELRAQRQSGQDLCLVDVPQWDLAWQELYRYPLDALPTLAAGDSVTLTCTFDNSAGNQPVFNGVQQPPRDVTWGEGSTDEMCQAYALLLGPYPPAAEALCPTLEGCLETCPKADGACFTGCLQNDGKACLDCVMPAAAACGANAGCLPQVGTLLSCINDCGGQPVDCYTGDGPCVAAFQGAYECAEPLIRDGSCDTDLGACGVSLAP